MALKAGYYGIKKFIADKLNRMNPGESFATDAEIAAAMQDVENTLKDAEVITCDNLLGWKYGYMWQAVDGTLAPSTNAMITDKLKTSAGSKFYIKKKNVLEEGAITAARKYDSNGDYIGYETAAEYNVLSAEYTVPSDVGYIAFVQFCGNANANKEFQDANQMIVSTIDIPFEPYYVPLKDVLPTKADISALGTQEGATASRLYHPGEHFYKDGKFYTVIGSADVAAGSTWTLNTNCVEGTIADNLIKQEAFTITTNAGGLANLTNQDSRIILRIDSANSKICFPYRTTSGTNNIIVFNNDMTVAADLEVSGIYYYI